MPAVPPEAAVGPLKNIHREFRTAALNMKYYGCRLDRYQQLNKCLEILIACGATTGTGIAGLAIWKNGLGTTAWGIISGVSIVLATIKPIIALPKEIERYSKLASGYATIYETYRGMEQDFFASGLLITEQIEQYNKLRAEMIKLAADDDRHPTRKLIKRFEDEVNKEIPASSLWMPALPAVPSAPAGAAQVAPAVPAAPPVIPAPPKADPAASQPAAE